MYKEFQLKIQKIQKPKEKNSLNILFSKNWNETLTHSHEKFIKILLSQRECH